MQTLIQATAQVLHQAQRISILTGAGVSKESGVPTFRDAMDGLWAKYDPQELATPEAFQANPKLVWDWYQWRRSMVNQAQPNAGHYALAELARLKNHVTLITQNVDDLHEQAGSPNVIHLHGNIARNKCSKNCQGKPTLLDIRNLSGDEQGNPPLCPHCGAYVRPDVVWFGEILPNDALEAATMASIHCDVMLVVGTSGLVNPAAALPLAAKNSGAKVIEVNPDYSAISRIAAIRLEAPSGVALPQVIDVLKNLS